MMSFRRRVPQRPRRTSRSHGTGDGRLGHACTEHKPSSDGGAILMFEPSGTLTTGDRHEGEIPGHVDSTAGHEFTTRE